ncbi:MULTISPECIES: TetR/AcrR family transcriptional regulator [Sphingobium]|uniref:TetR/AcrR family transcriptional regulator n=1 Tax=Sphingobium agri TaxID=2933566 RepID=A0ABT0E1L3_9SPHN|nr:TetR/AcrR family transcriptional regulator [Sphingobium agri]MCK0533259.1 TetR/AcrR family transcriptional regulator [Sphingobium agri]
MTRGSIRPGGRTERVRQTVAATVLQFIKNGETEFTMQDVAEHAGIARSTLYARWATREALIVEALTAHNATFRVKPRADWREHLQVIAIAFRDFSARPDEIAINGLVAHLGSGFVNEETLRQWRAIAEEMVGPLDVAKQEGKIRAEVNTLMVITTLFTSIAGLIVIAKDQPSDAYVRQLVDLLIAGCEA